MKHKYLDDLNIKSLYPNESDGARFVDDVEKYGFASKETWSLDFALMCWIYERFSMFKEVNIIALDRETLTVDSETKSAKDWLDEIISLSKEVCTNYEDIEKEDEMFKKQQRVLLIIKETIRYWWW